MDHNDFRRRRNLENSTRVVDFLAQFFVSQGLSYDAVSNHALQNLIRELRPDISIPTPQILQKSVESLQSHWKGAFSNVAEVSVTFDVVNFDDEQKFLVFSAHFFGKPNETIRQNLVYFRRLESPQIEGRIVLNTLLRTIRRDFHPNCHIRNLMVPSREIDHQYGLADMSISNNFICFHHFLTFFVEDVLQIEEFARALSLIRKFIKSIKYQPDLLEKFDKMQITYNDVVALPTLPKRNWESVTEFLGSFLASYETLMRFAGRYHLRIRISDTLYHQLVYLHKILDKCSKYSRELSHPQSSIAQVIPAIVGMKNFIFQLSTGYSFEGVIKRMYANVFQNITSGEVRQFYDMATLLDPRFGYRDDLYADMIWLDIEKKVIRGNSDENTELRKMLIVQVRSFRRWIWESRPAEHENPLDWWVAREDELAELAQIARSFFTCSPVSIDGAHFFGPGGKLSHLAAQNIGLDNYLNAAGYQQEFRAKGSDEMSSESSIVELEAPEPSITVKQEPDDVPEEYLSPEVREEMAQFTGYTPSEWSASSSPAPESSKPLNGKRRHCTLCGQLQYNHRTRNVRNESERLLLALGALYHQEIEPEEAVLLFNKKRIFVCRHHFVSSSRALLDKLRAQHPEQQIRPYTFVTIMKDMADMFDVRMDAFHVQKIVTVFTGKYHDLPEERPDRLSEEDEVHDQREPQVKMEPESEEPVRKSARAPKRKLADDYDYACFIK